MIMIIIAFIIVGLVTGILAGLLGIGGGVITVPAMYYLFKAAHFPEEDLMHTCVATALAATMLTSIGSTWSHHKKGALIPSVIKLIAPGLMMGCLLGAMIATYLSGNALRITFGSMAALFAIYFFFPKLPPLHIAHAPNKSLVLFGICIGTLSSLLGVGGGIFMVPILLGYKVSMQNTVAASSAGTLVTAFMGTIVYLYIAYGKTYTLDTIGYIDIPAFLAIGLCSLATTSLGCKLSHSLPTGIIKRVFAIALAATGIAMILSS